MTSKGLARMSVTLRDLWREREQERERERERKGERVIEEGWRSLHNDIWCAVNAGVARRRAADSIVT